MRVIVLGSGVIGVSTAYYLARRGASVTVLERQPGPAMETSFANAGQVSPGYSTPWAAPGLPFKALKWLFQKHAPLALRPDGSLFQLRWLAAILANCSAARYAVNKERMLRLAEYSRDCLRALREDTGIQYEQRTRGLLQLLRTDAQVKAVARDMAVLQQYGVAHELLHGSARLREFEPGLAYARTPLAGGLLLPGDETGDCELFTARLAELAAGLGVAFRYEQQAMGLETEGDSVTTVRVGNTYLSADAVVAALGSYTRGFLAPLGINLPVYPVKGYSLTLPVADEARAPQSTVIDETYKVAVTRLGEHIRVGGMAELAGFDLRLNPRRRATLAKVIDDLYPGSGTLANASFWTGLRPMTPDSTPIVGATPRYRNLYLNTGHGTLGWTMACGSGRILADLITGATPEIRVDDFGLARYSRAAGSV